MICSGIVALTFLSVTNAINYSGTFYLFAAVSLVSIFFYGCALPETKVISASDARHHTWCGVQSVISIHHSRR
jgi:hypothetical protein